MVAIATLERYISLCSNTINTNNTQKAEDLEKEIVSVFSSEIEDITLGLSNYSIGYEAVDFIGDINLLRSKLEAELEKINESEQQKTITNCKKKFLLVIHQKIVNMLNLL